MRHKVLTGLVGLGLWMTMTVTASATIIDGDVTGGAGTFEKLDVPFTESDPDNTVGNNTFQSPNLFGFDEGQNILVTVNLNVDDVADGLGGGAGAGVIPLGTLVASHYVFFDPELSSSQTGVVKFDSDILAVISSRANLAASDFLINTGVTYLNPGARGLESGDSVTINGLDEILVDWTASTPGDYIRILTAFSPAGPPAPGVAQPHTLVLLLTGLVSLAELVRRRRQPSRL